MNKFAFDGPFRALGSHHLAARERCVPVKLRAPKGRKGESPAQRAGKRRQKNFKSPEGATDTAPDLVPYIPFIETDLIFGKQAPVFLLEGYHPMVFTLTGEIILEPQAGEMG